MDLENLSGLTDRNIQENLSIIISKVKEVTTEQMEGCIKGTELTIKCTAKAFSLAKTVESSLASIFRIKNTEKASSLGQMVGNLWENGTTENRWVQGLLCFKKLLLLDVS